VEVMVVSDMRIPVEPEWGTKIKLSLYLAVPALLYTVSDNLNFYILQCTDPATYAVLRQARMLITALLFRFALGRLISPLQWFAIFQLLLSALLFESEILEASFATPAAGGPPPQHSKQLQGVFLIAIKCCFDATAVIFQDKYFKSLEKEFHFPFVQQQVFYGLYSSLMATLVCAALNGSEILGGRPFFDQWTQGAVAAVFLFGMYGIFVSLFLRYLDAMLKMFQSMIAVILTMVLTVALFGTHISIVKWMAAAFVLLSSTLYKMGTLKATTFKEVQSFFKSMDTDNDGYVSIAEFSAWYKNPRSSPDERRAAVAVAKTK